MTRQGLGFLVAAAAAVGVGILATRETRAADAVKGNSAGEFTTSVKTRPAVPPFNPGQPPFFGVPSMANPKSNDVLAMQRALGQFFADDRNPIVAADGSRVIFGPDEMTGTFDLPTMTAVWLFQKWNNQFNLTGPDGVELTETGLIEDLTYNALMRMILS